MQPEHTTPLEPAELFRLLRLHWLRWLLPTALMAGAAGAYAQFRTLTWEASQALVVRNDAGANQDKPGHFRHENELKMTQETLVEIARNRAVVAQALSQVGPPEDYPLPGAWPTEKDVTTALEKLSISAPTGSEFGQTEVFYVKARHASAQRAVAMATAICDRLDAEFKQIRDQRARSLLGELESTSREQEAMLARLREPLTQMEQKVGADLAELRILHQAPSDSSELRRHAIELESKLSTARALQRDIEELQTLLSLAKDEPKRLIAAPVRLLEMQPSLRQLKEGLVRAQLETAQLQGRVSDKHPAYVAALAAENEIKLHIHRELGTLRQAAESDLRLARSQLDLLAAQKAEVQQRMERLAGMRANYSSLVVEVENQQKLLADTQRRLAEAQLQLVSADTGSLLSRIDVPRTGDRPVGPGRLTIGGMGLAAGLATGLGLLLLTAPRRPLPPPPDLDALAAERAETFATRSERREAAARLAIHDRPLPR